MSPTRKAILLNCNRGREKQDTTEPMNWRAIIAKSPAGTKEEGVVSEGDFAVLAANLFDGNKTRMHNNP